MTSTTSGQIYIFFVTLYGGIIMGLIYDLYRIFRYFIKPKRVATAIEDFIFWMIVTGVALFFLFSSSWGEVRGFVFVGFFCGAFLYSRFLSKIVITALVKIACYCSQIIKSVVGYLLWPFRVIGRVLVKPFKKLGQVTRTGYTKVKRIVKLPINMIADIKKHTHRLKKKK